MINEAEADDELAAKERQYALYHTEFAEYTMVPEALYVKNLLLVDQFAFVSGPVVECGTWKGGMIAGIAKALGPGRSYHLFDSYQGLPPAKEIDGPAALRWQADTAGPQYYDNCTASEADARAAMRMSGASDWDVVPGWFEDTLRTSPLPEGIAILRLDGDWYDSTMTCLDALFPRVARQGIVIIDDYHVYDGCSAAVHDYLSSHNSDARISQFMNAVAYIQKR
jgi:O-methyltransferase